MSNTRLLAICGHFESRSSPPQKKTRNGPRPRRSCTNAALYAPPLMRAMSASCSALTRSSDSYSTCRRSSSRRRSRAAADFTAESRRRRSDSAAAWLRLPTARSFSRSVAAAFRVAFHRGFGRVRRAGTERASARETGEIDTRRATRRRNTRRRRAETGETTRPKGPPSLRREHFFTQKTTRSFVRARDARRRRETYLSVHRVHHGGDRIAELRHLVAEVARGLRELLRPRVLLRVQHADAVRLGGRGRGGGGADEMTVRMCLRCVAA